MARTVIDILEELEETAGSNAKRDILEAARHNQLLKRVFLAAQDRFTVYYVNKFTMPKSRPVNGAFWPDDEIMNVFLSKLLPQLASREVTGNAAKQTVVSLFEEMDPRQQKWCQRILLHNLRCGVQEGTVNKVWPGLIKGFAVALAVPLRTSFTPGTGLELLEPVSYPVLGEPKLDGLRLIAVKKAGEVTLFTRNGTLLETLPKIQWILQDSRYDDVVLDGEAMGADWNESTSVLMSSKNKKDDEKIVYNVFDAVPLADWLAQSCPVPYSERMREVQRIAGLCNHRVRQVPHTVIHNDEELMAFFAQCMDQGYEGAMLKSPDALYDWDRSRNLLKLKPVTTYEGVVTAWYEGRRGTKHEGRFGGFEVVLPNGVITRVGGGFNDKVRAQVALDTPDAWVGRIVECEAQPDPLTPDGLTGDGKMRFPVYMRTRDASDVDPKVTAAYAAWKALRESAT